MHLDCAAFLARACAVFALLTLGLLPAEAAEPPLVPLNQVLEELRQGGLVIYLRHTATDTSPASSNPEDSANCETQRKLSPQGHNDAVLIGKAIKALRIPIDKVIAGPYCRTRDTAQLAFGSYVTNPDLAFVLGTDIKETQRRAEALRRLLATPPAPGSNTVLISHSANLFEAAGIFAKPEGAAYVFRPQAEGRFVPLARVLPEDWGEVARISPAAGRSRASPQ
ncbi:MAG TPA: histidine phosphatase family protein [Rhodocyclaceae bacterium]